MIYVINDLASEIKRKPTNEEKEIVSKQKKLSNELYKRYMELYSGKKVTGIDAGLRDKLWNRYLKENSKYNDLFNKYIGYCY